jgi:hypothetical protein
MKPRAVALVLSLLVAAPALASAAPAKDGSDPAAAQTLFYDARSLMKAGRYAEACPKLEESLRLDEGIGTRYNLADCQEHIGKIATAWAGFLEVAARAKAAKQPEREKIARQRAIALEPRLPKLKLDVESRPEGLEITRDGVVIGSAAWGTPIPIDPGRHALRATAPGKQPWETSIDAPEGRTVEVSVKALAPAIATAAPPATPPVAVATPPAVLPPPEAPLETTPPPPGETETTGAIFPPPVTEQSGSTQRTVGWIVGGAGVAALGVAGGFGIYSMTKRSRANDHCDGSACDARGVALKNDAIKAGNVATITGIAGGAALAGGLLLVLTAPSDGDLPPTAGAEPAQRARAGAERARAASAITSIRAFPMVAWGGAGIGLHGSLP